MTDHEHKGLGAYIHNPGHVSPDAGPLPDQNEKAPKRENSKEKSAPTAVPVYPLENTQQKHSGTEAYAHNPGVVSKDARIPESKDEHAPDPLIKRRPVKPLPAIPTEGGRPAASLDLGSRTQMSPEAFASKGFEEDLQMPEAAEVKDLI